MLQEVELVLSLRTASGKMYPAHFHGRIMREVENVGRHLFYVRFADETVLCSAEEIQEVSK